MIRNRIDTYLGAMLLALFSSTTVAAQYGIDGGIVAIAHRIQWYAVEEPRLDNISEGQDYLLISNVALALEEAKLLDVKRKRYKSLSETDQSVEEAETLLQIVDHSADLYNIQDQTFNLVAPYPEIEAIISPAETDLLLEVGFLLNDVYLGTFEGQTNLMDSSDRLLFLKGILSKIDQINILAAKILRQAEYLIALEQSEFNTELPLFDYSEAFNTTLQEIQELITVEQ